MNSMTRGVPVAHRSRRPLANCSPWSDVLLLSLLVVVPAAIIALSGYSAARSGNPSDDDLTARFLSHQADFEALLEERRRFAIRNIHRYLFNEATGPAARRVAKPNP